MNGQEVIKELQHLVSEGLLNLHGEYFGSSEPTENLLKVLGDYKIVFDDRLAEDDHDTYCLVFHFLEHSLYIACYGYYSSQDGVDWSDVAYVEVKPVEVTRTEYHRV